MRFRILSLLLALVMMFSLFGCDFFKNKITDDTTEQSNTADISEIDTEKYDTVDRSLVDFRTSLYDSVELTKGFEALKTEEQRTCYGLIDESVVYVSKEKTDSSYAIAPVRMKDTVLTEAQIHLVISAYAMDHPQIFWVESSFSYEVSGGTTVLYLNSGMSAQEITDTAKQMGENIEDIFEDIPGGLSAYERELQIHDAFAQRCEYAENTDDFRVYTSVGGLVDNLAVCEGYSRSMQILLSMAEIETYYVFGTGSEELHMWNVVNIDDVWYHLDATWNDNDDGTISYSYFNLTESEITEDHTLSPYYWDFTEEEICGGDSGQAISFNIYIPKSNVSGGSYYRNKAVTITGFDDDNLNGVATAIIEALDRGEEFIYIYIDPSSLVYADAVKNLFDDGDYAIFECIKRTNQQIYYTQINDEHVEIVEMPEENIVCVYFEQV